MIKLILFDVDGTLLDAGDLSRRCFLDVVGRFRVPARGTSAPGVGRSSFSGKTDPQIMRELLRESGLSAEETDRVLGPALAGYQSCFLSRLEGSDIRPLAGARELIERLAAVPSERLLLGILSGNLEALVAPKLEAAGFRPSSFVVGAFGSDDADRDNLPAIAVQKVEKAFGRRILPDEVAIVGDTPLDVRCARGFGAVSVAVATGEYTREQLEATGPAYVLDNLLQWIEFDHEV
jgi:phosphoglycolate phosphatase